MRAMVLERVGELVEREVARPEAGAGQVRVRVEACGVCHTDLHELEGELALVKRPVIPGHQVVGRVDQVGEGVEGVAVGDRVGLAWLGWTCGECGHCRSGRENLCEGARFTGWHFDGGYAEYVVAEAGFVYRVAESLEAVAVAPLLCAGIIGYRALRRAGADQGGRVGLYGFGASAHIAMQVARHWGCEVHVFSRTQEHLAMARAMGAVWAGRLVDWEGEGLDCAVVFAPAGGVVVKALEQVGKGGRVAAAGIYVTDIGPLSYERHLFYEKELVSVTAATREDGRGLLALAGEVGIEAQAEVFGLEEANEALRRVKASEVNGAAVLDLGVRG